MKLQVKKLKNCKRVIEVELSIERVKNELDKVYEGIRKVASIPGFRVGKAPRDLIEINYAGTAKEEVIKRLIPESYKKALEENNLDTIGYPEILDVKLDEKEGFSYKANIETRPVFTLRQYKGLKLKRKIVEVKEEDVKRNLQSLRELSAQKVPGKEGEEKKKVIPELDDEFAKDLGFENLEKLKEGVRKNLEVQLEREAQADLEMQVINQLLDSSNFEVPLSLVNAEKERLIEDAQMRVRYLQEVQKTKDPNKKFELTAQDKKELEEGSYKQAVRQVKAFFILDRIAEEEKIYLKPEELDKRIEEIARANKKSKEALRSYLEKNSMLNEMALNMRNGKVMEFLLKEAKIT